MLEDYEVQQILDRAEQATPGPWTIGFDKSMRSAWAVLKAGTATTVVHLDPDKNVDLDIESHRVDANLDFIQNAREDVPKLVETIRELKASGHGEPVPFDAELQIAVARLASEVERLKQILYFYAHPETYKQKPPDEAGRVPDWIGTDLGARARVVFTAPKPEDAQG